MADEQPIESKKTDWGQSDEIEDEFLTSDFSHKAWLTKSRMPAKLKRITDLLQKELALSRISRTEAYIYALYFSAALDWVKYGFYDLAGEEMVKLMGKLQLFRSIGGFERMGQNTNVAPQITYDMSDEQLEQVNSPEAQAPGRRGPSILNQLLGVAAKRRRR